MKNTFYATKIGMGEAYIGDTRHGVTRLKLFPMTVTQQKTLEKDGYLATQVVFGAPKKKTTQAISGHLKKSKATGKYFREISATESLELGSVISTDAIQVGSVVDVSGVSKGKGMAGVMKRWNFSGGPRTHGQSDRGRAPGSIGQGTTPGRVYKGKHMAARMGGNNVTTKNATVIAFDPASSTLIVTGPVPGHVGTVVSISLTDATKKQLDNIKISNFTPTPAPEVEAVPAVSEVA